MQTFLPYADFSRSLRCLDRQRLGKQRVEARQIIDTIEGRSEGWKNHPAVIMWRQNVDALKIYFNLSCLHWMERGYQNNYELYEIPENYSVKMPSWLGYPPLHSTHRGRLLDKDPIWYGQFRWRDARRSKDEGYFWPGDTYQFLDSRDV